MKTNVRRIIAGAVIAFAPLVTVLAPGVAHAATKTWIGGGSDTNWSTTANWQGGVAPVSGDAVVIDLAATNGIASVDDISGLSLAGLTVIHNAPSGGVSGDVFLNTNLTLTGPVNIDSTVNTTIVSLRGETAARTITLGADVTINDAGDAFNLGGNTSGTDVVNLNSHTLTWHSTGDLTAADNNDVKVTGSGGVVYNFPYGKVLVVNGTNDYTGTTQLLSGTYQGGVSMFGGSSVSLASAATVSFSSSTNATISNTIAVAGVNQVSSQFVSLAFDASGANGTPVVFTAPNITLNGDAAFSLVGTGSTVNLAGITANGHCIEYVGPNSNGDLTGPGNGFLNGPSFCLVSNGATAAPGTPNTGFKLIAANPVQTLAVSVVAFLALAGIAYKVRSSSARR